MNLSFWLIKRGDPQDANWLHWASQWEALIDTSLRYRTVTMRVATIDDMTAREHQTSQHLDLDQLSISVAL